MDTKTLKRGIILPMLILWMAIGAALTAYWFKFGDRPFSSNPDAWGQFGDYIGGVLNPLISFGAFVLLATSVILQKTELEETRTALAETSKAQERQAFTALLAAKVQTANIKLLSVASALTHRRAHRADLVKIAQTRGTNIMAIDERGDPIVLATMLAQENIRIDELVDEEAKLLAEIESYALRLES